MATGYSVPETITDDAGNALKGQVVDVTGPDGYEGTATTHAVTGLLRLGPLPVEDGQAYSDYTITLGTRSAIVPVFASVDAGEGGGGGGAIDSVNGQTGVVVLDAADVGADLAGAAAAAQAAAVTAAAAAAVGLYQPLDSDLTAIAALTTTTFGRALLELANAAAARTALGLGSAALAATTAFDAVGSAAAAQAASQPLDSDLTAIAALSTTPYGRAFLALADAAAARAAVGLGNVDNTADSAKPVSTAQQAALDAKADKLLVENPQTGTAYTLVLGDASKLVEMSNAAANTLTVPPNSSVAFPVGTVINVRQYGAGQTTLTPGAGVTIRSRGGALKLHSQYAEASLVKRATDEWVATGDLTT